MSSVKLGYGSQFQRGNGASPEVFTAIAEAVEIAPPNMSRAAIDVTSHDSANGFREFIGGLADGGEVTVMAQWLPANATHAFSTGLGADFMDGLVHNYKLVLPNSLGSWTFAGVVTRYNPSVPLDGKMGLSVTIKVSGKPTIA